MKTWQVFAASCAGALGVLAMQSLFAYTPEPMPPQLVRIPVPTPVQVAAPPQVTPRAVQAPEAAQRAAPAPAAATTAINPFTGETMEVPAQAPGPSETETMRRSYVEALAAEYGLSDDDVEGALEIGADVNDSVKSWLIAMARNEVPADVAHANIASVKDGGRQELQERLGADAAEALVGVLGMGDGMFSGGAPAQD